MINHLPECPVGPGRMLVGVVVCQCEILRACEQRMREEHRHRCSRCDWCYSDGVREALNAAREAVKGVNWFNDEGKMLSAVVATADSIAAIDALRKETND